MKLKLAIVALNAAGAAGVSASFPAGRMLRVLEEDCITEEELALGEVDLHMSLSMSLALETGDDAAFGRKKRNLRGGDVRRRTTVRKRSASTMINKLYATNISCCLESFVHRRE